MTSFKQSNRNIHGNQYNAGNDINIHQLDTKVPLPRKVSFDAISKLTSPIKSAQMHSVFLSYSPEDAQLLHHFKNHLMPLQRAHLINTWYDRDIKAGVDRQKEIETHFMQADLILLLISPDFMASDYCYGVEMQQALKRQKQNKTHVIPIILRPVHWQDAPFNKLQILPRDTEPVVSPKHFSIDEAFLQVVRDIRYIIEKHFLNE